MLSREVPSLCSLHSSPGGLRCLRILKRGKYSLRDASEFSTAINACSRHQNPEVALKVLKGDRGMALDEMEAQGKEHRRYLAEKMN